MWNPGSKSPNKRYKLMRSYISDTQESFYNIFRTYLTLLLSLSNTCPNMKYKLMSRCTYDILVRPSGIFNIYYRLGSYSNRFGSMYS